MQQSRLAALLLLTLALLAGAACGTSSSSAPPKIRLAADAPFAGRALAAARDLLTPQHLGVELATEPASADVVLSTTPSKSNGALSFTAAYWVPVTQLPSSARALSMAELGDAVAGRSTHWPRVLVPSDTPPPLGQWWPEVTPAVEARPLDEIRAVLFVDPTALALLPLDAVDARVRSLAVDGVNIVFGTGDTSKYTLTQRAWVTKHNSGNQAFDAALSAVATRLSASFGAAVPNPIIMRSTGDVIPSRCTYVKLRDYGDYRHAFLKLGRWLAQADLTTGSVDATMADVSPPLGCTGTFNLAAPAASIDGLAYAGYDVITIATNHAMDCGQVGACGDQALLATIENLRARGIQAVGGGANLAEARKPVFLTIKGVRFAFLGYDDIAEHYHAAPDSGGTAPLDEAYVRADVAAAKAQADIVIVMPHWGVEYTSDPTARQQKLAAAALEAGATMVLGNHPHWVQAVQVTHDTFVTYALGNFVFDQNWSLETQQGAVLEAAFQGAQLKGIEIYPVHIYDQNQPAFAEGSEAQQILNRIWDATARLQ